MSEPAPIRHLKQRLLTKDAEGYDDLAELALDMRFDTAGIQRYGLHGCPMLI